MRPRPGFRQARRATLPVGLHENAAVARADRLAVVERVRDVLEETDPMLVTRLPVCAKGKVRLR